MAGSDLITTHLGNETSGTALFDVLSKISIEQYLATALAIIIILLVIRAWFRHNKTSDQ